MRYINIIDEHVLPSLKMPEMMLACFPVTFHLSYANSPLANQKLCLVCALLPYQNTNLIFCDILVEMLPNYRQLQTSESIHVEDHGGYLFSVREEKQTNFPPKQKPRLPQDS